MENSNDKRLFWACLVALIATAFGFSIRTDLIDTWAQQFDLTASELGQISGVGLWPFAISIILFSLVIDKIGYGRAMVFAFFAHITYAIVVICAPLVLAGEGASLEEVAAGKRAGFWMLYFGNLIFALGNGTVEAVINPVVATMFRRDKTKWLNILHAGWPGGLVLAGLIAIGLGDQIDWRIKVGLIFIPAVIYGFLMLSCRFPVNERVAAGSSYMDMLREFGAIGAGIVTWLIVFEVTNVLKQSGWMFQDAEFWSDNAINYLRGGVAIAVALAFGAYTISLGRPLFIFLLLIMIPLATTELGTDNWITTLLKPAMTELGANAGWVLVYTSFIMMILRFFFAGPIVHKLTPLGLLAVSAVIAAIGLVFLSQATGIMILVAATLYGLGKTFFWPTTLGVVAEQFPKGGALTLNAIAGVGMLSVGVVGSVLIGFIQDTSVAKRLIDTKPEIANELLVEKTSIFGDYKAASPVKVAELPEADKEDVTKIENEAKQSALKTMAIFPSIMFVCYVILILYFRSKGGYKPQLLGEEGGAH